MVAKFHSSLLHDLSLMLSKANDHDVIIQVGENQSIKEFRAHSNILKSRSTYFKIALSTGWAIKKDNLIEFKKPNISPTVFEMILKYIYTGNVDLTSVDNVDILGLLVASDELLLDELFDCVQDYLMIEKKTTQNLVLILNTIFKLTNCKKLQDHYVESIFTEPQLFITSENSEDFLSLDKDILYEFISRL